MLVDYGSFTNKIGATIASKACLRSGVGLLTVAFYPENKVFFSLIPETIGMPILL